MNQCAPGPLRHQTTDRWRVWPLLLLLCSLSSFGADTITTNQIGQGVVYRHYHYDSLYNAKEEIYVVDVNLNDPAPSMRFPYLAGGATRTVSGHAATVAGAIACVNGQFFNTTTGSVAFLKVNGTVITPTQAAVHDEQGLTDDGAGHTNSLGVTLRPTGGWANFTGSNALTAGPDLIRNGVKFTSYDFNDSLVTNRNPRTCAAWTYDNHLLLTVVDGRSTASAGLTLPELRDYLYTNAAVRNAFNLDGGGSSTMWVNGSVKNVPSDGQPRAVADAVAIVAPPPAIPGAPASLSATPTATNILLAWPLTSGAMSYNVKRSTTSGGSYTRVANTAALSYADTNLAPGTTYYYVVSATNSVGESTNSLQAVAVTIPPAPTNLLAVPGNNEVLLNWNAVPGASGYKLKRALSSSGSYLVIAHLAATAYTNTSVLNGTNYYFVVSATNSTGESANSLPVSATPQLLLLSPPTLSGATILLQASGGVSGQLFYLLSSTNLSLPLSNWTVVATNRFDSGGSGAVTNPLLPSVPQQYFRLQAPLP